MKVRGSTLVVWWVLLACLLVVGTFPLLLLGGMMLGDAPTRPTWIPPALVLSALLLGPWISAVALAIFTAWSYEHERWMAAMIATALPWLFIVAIACLIMFASL